MRRILLTLLMLLMLACNTEPVPLITGKDICSFCKMPVADLKFGAEIITSKGRIYKYDDVICMINWLKSDGNSKVIVSRKLIADYKNIGELIDAKNAVFVLSNNIRTPMNSGIAAFKTTDEALKAIPFAEQTLSWEQILSSLN